MWLVSICVAMKYFSNDYDMTGNIVGASFHARKCVAVIGYNIIAANGVNMI